MISFEQSGDIKKQKQNSEFISKLPKYIEKTKLAKLLTNQTRLDIKSQSINQILFTSNSILFSIINGCDTFNVEYSEKLNAIHYQLIFKKWALFRILIFTIMTLFVGFFLLSHLFSVYIFHNFHYPSNIEIYVYIVPMMIFLGIIWPLLLIKKRKQIIKNKVLQIFLQIVNKDSNRNIPQRSIFFIPNSIREISTYLLLLLSCFMIGYLIHRRCRFGPAQFGYSFTSAQPDWKMPRKHFSIQGVDVVTTTKDDFPGFLGKDRNCAVENININPDWKKFPPKLLWRKPIGGGWSAFSIVNGFAVTMEQRGPEEQVTCYDLYSGKQYWSTGWDGRFFLFGEGPRSTPAIAHGKVFALGAFGELVCINGNTGTIIWRNNLLTSMGITLKQDHKELSFGRSNSPIVDNNIITWLADSLNQPLHLV